MSREGTKFSRARTKNGGEAASKTPSGRAPGYRPRSTGELWAVGNNGYSWSSTISSIQGMYLALECGMLDPVHIDSRAYGLQLRCLSE